MQSSNGRFAGDYLCGNKSLTFGSRTLIMGILNVTPDSFSDGGEYLNVDVALKHALDMQKDGADVIDIGGESSRPNGSPISADEEIARVVPVIEAIRRESDIILSIDTVKSEVAKAALAAGCDIVNDISGLRFDSKMGDVVASTGAGVVLMYNSRLCGGLENRPEVDCVAEAVEFLTESIRIAKACGIEDNHIMTDPGIGFGTNRMQDLMLTNCLGSLSFDGKYPVLYGASRKRIAQTMLEQGESREMLDNITAGLCMAGAIAGASMVRVHDITSSKSAVTSVDETIYPQGI